MYVFKTPDNPATETRHTILVRLRRRGSLSGLIPVNGSPVLPHKIGQVNGLIGAVIRHHPPYAIAAKRVMNAFILFF
jgi:hypothetical protein